MNLPAKIRRKFNWATIEGRIHMTASRLRALASEIEIKAKQEADELCAMADKLEGKKKK